MVAWQEEASLNAAARELLQVLEGDGCGRVAVNGGRRRAGSYMAVRIGSALMQLRAELSFFYEDERIYG